MDIGQNKSCRLKSNHQRELDIKTMSIFVIFGLIVIQVENTNGLDAVCIPGVSKYASSEGLGFYYECQSEDDSPVLKQCPEGALWDRKTMLCGEKPSVRQAEGEYKGFDKNDEPKKDFEPASGKRVKRETSKINEKDESEIIFQPVLGRSVSLGDLFDARRDLPLNGFSLWNEKVIEEKKLIKGKPYSNTHFFYEKSQNDRFSKFSIEASLKTSFLGGLIEVSGSAKYLKDEKKTSNIIRFNMMYEATTKTESLPMSLRQDLTYPDICGKFMKNSDSGPTHVISSVEYGMKAVFMFERFVSSNESVEDIKGKLKVVINSIPNLKAEVEAEADIKEKKTNFNETLKTKMFGDFIVEHSPTTYAAAKQVYRDLPKYLGDKATNYRESSPVKIMLTPLGKYCTESHLVMTGISAELMTKTTEIMLDLGKVMLNVRTLESTYLAHKFLDVSALLKLFRIELDVYTIEIKTKLKDIIPTMRGGGGEEQLPILLKGYADSAFQFDYALRFLQERERELNTINSLFDDRLITNGDITIGDFTSANVAHALLHKTYVFIYKFNVFSNIDVTKDYLEKRTITANTWYNDYKLIGLAGFNWREFKSFVNINKDSSLHQEFFIQGSPLGDKLTQIFVYQNGIQLTSDFKVPMPPPKPKVIGKTYKTVTLLLGNAADIMKNEFVNEVVVKYGTELESESEYREVIINTNVNQLWTKGTNVDCWKHCDGGPCEKVCGAGGYCCRKGFHDCPDGAQKLATGFHSCIINYANKTGKIVTTVDIPLEVKVGNTSHHVPVTHTFKTVFQTAFGRGRDSEALTGVRPLPSSPPKLEPVDHIDSTSMKLTWQKPDFISGHLTLSGYKLNIINVNIFNTSAQEMTITDLEPATKYTVYLEAWFSDWMIVGETTQVDIHTIPTQPEKPTAVNIGKHDVALQLDSKEELKIAAGEIFKRYNVIFYKVDLNMTKIPGTQYEMNFQKSEIKISSLTQGTNYNFEYKIVTSKGSSLSSPPLLVETNYNKTELDEINEEIETRSAEMRKHINTEISNLKLTPLGTITAWVMNPMNKSGSMVPLPEGWQKCDGSIIPQPSIWAGLRTPNLNGERRFLRGGNDQDMLNMEEDTTKIPDHTHKDNGHTHTATSKADSHSHSYLDRYLKFSSGGGASGSRYQFQEYNTWKTTDTATVTVRTTIQKSYCSMGGVNSLGNFAKETRPKNMNVIYIIRIL